MPQDLLKPREPNVQVLVPLSPTYAEAELGTLADCLAATGQGVRPFSRARSPVDGSSLDMTRDTVQGCPGHA